MPDPSYWVPPEVDTETPSAARLYDYYLGGGYHFAADRALGDQVLSVFPSIRYIALANRKFVVRAVRQLALAGFDQFIDIGCGLPGVGSVHEVAQHANPNATVVYVDNELVAVKHAELMLADTPGTGVVEADVRDPLSILDHGVTRALVDFTRPVVVVLAAVMHFVPDAERPARIMAVIRDALPAGSLLVFTHGTAGQDASAAQAVVNLYRRSQNTAVPRTRDEVEALLGGWDVLAPGVQWVTDLLPEGAQLDVDGPRCHTYGAIARVPGGPDTYSIPSARAQLRSGM